MSLLSKFFGKKPQIQKTKTTDNIAFYCVYLADTCMPFLDGMSIVISKKAEVPQIVKDKPTFNLQLYMVAIKEAEKETFFLDCYSSGYGDIWFDGEEKHISDYITIPQKGFKNRELCLEMVKVGQIRAIISHTVDKTPVFFLRQQANEQMSQMIFQKLLESELYTVDQENSKYHATAVVTTPRHKGKWIALFTDALAAKKYMER